MRIGIDGRPLERERTGVARYLLGLLRMWTKEHRAHEYYLYFEHEVPTDPILDEACFTKRLPARLPLLRQNIRQLLWEQTILPLAARRNRVDLLFSPGYTLPALFGGPAAVTIHDVSYEAHPEWSRMAQRWRLRTFSRLAARRARVVLTDSQFSRQELLKYYRLPASKVRAIPLAADDFVRPVPAGEASRIVANRFGLKGQYLLFVGSIFSRRHIPTLLEAFELALKDGGPASLVLVGADSLRGSFDLSRAIEVLNLRLGRRAVVHFPRVEEDELLSLYNAATAFIFLSDYEGFGLTLLEAMACGTPVISARTSSIPEVVGDAAVLVSDSADPLEVSRAILAVSGDAERRDHMIRLGLEQAARFSWRRCAEDTLGVLVQCGRTPAHWWGA
ncbi:MAG TPA: glycosyltransferase family 1 protein [Candidatus Methylomirabilis sp.]|nr:glycosyltransferase family 1 protein [Candidatus Methylomirabilis sp.]